MSPLLDAEWGAYAGAALLDWETERVAHEEALATQGHSTFYNSRVRWA
jgi:hypothetical protein